jgi:hypothetical protein
MEKYIDNYGKRISFKSHDVMLIEMHQLYLEILYLELFLEHIFRKYT